MSDEPKLTDLQQRERQTWQYRAVEATRGPQSRLGCILLAVLGRSVNRPAYGPSAVIKANGLMISNFVDRFGQMHVGAPVGMVDEVVNNFRGLADALQLSDQDRIELIGELRKWVVRDYSNETYEGYDVQRS